jgi:hypothetical protein
VGLAASKYFITSTSQIKPSVLKQLRGKQGRAGQVGAQGATGAAGTFSGALVVDSTGPTQTLCASGGGSCDLATSTATCPGGMTVVNGGWDGGLTSGVVIVSAPTGTR